LAFGLTICLLGIGIVTLLANQNAGIITAFSAFFYVCIYTMLLKRRTPQNIVIGGLAGATPPAIGWAAASGDIDSVLPWLMVLTIFMWTPPHFWSLTLSKRRDYGEAGVPMLPVVRGEDVTRNHIAGYTIALIFTNILIYVNGATVHAISILGSPLSWGKTPAFRASLCSGSPSLCLNIIKLYVIQTNTNNPTIIDQIIICQVMPA
jgi:protoheme IX farnesyltransferase